MLAEDARRETKNASEQKQNIEMTEIDKQLDELYYASLNMIESDAKSGKSDCLFCMEYERGDSRSFLKNLDIAERLAFRLNRLGYNARNYGVFGHPLGVSISWKEDK